MRRKLLKTGTEGVWLPASRTKPIRSDLSLGLCPYLRLSCTSAGDVIQRPFADLGTFSWHVQIRARQHSKGFVLAPAIDCEIPVQRQHIRGPKLVRQTNQARICN